MRILVELFDQEPIENLLGSCVFEPDLLLFLCDKRDATAFREQNVYRMLRRRGLKTRVRFFYFDACDPAQIRRVLAAVVRDHPDCVFDYTGGSDLALVVLGAFAQRHDLPGYYIDMQTGSFINVNRCEEFAPQFVVPVFSIEDVVTLAGAQVHGYGHLSPCDIDTEFETDALNIWKIVHYNPIAWSDFVADLQAICSGTSIQALSVAGKAAFKKRESQPFFIEEIARKLVNIGVLSEFYISRGTVHLRFKNVKLKRSLLNSGVWLELYCYFVARQAGVFNDVRHSVVIDWELGSQGGESAKNEVDLMLVRGVTPVFVSCKMNLPSPLALTEIKLLSVKFGGAHARAVLVCDAPLGKDNAALQARAREMDILLVGRDDLNEETLAQKFIYAVGPEPLAPVDPLSLRPPLP